MGQCKYLILGGGMAGGYAASELIKQQIDGEEICMVSMDKYPPYQRPPLSKGYLAGEEEIEDILIKPDSFYEDNGIDLRLQTRITDVDLEGRTVSSASDVQIEYETLIIATGSWVRYLDVPGSDLDGILYLRDVEMSDAIRQAAQEADRAAVVGGGFIGTEVAAYLAEADVRTSLIYRGKHLVDTIFTPQMSGAYERAFDRHGVELIPGAEAAGFEGEDRVTGVKLSSGQTVPADMVVAGVGAKQEVGLFSETPIEAEGHIQVDEFLQTDVMDVYACGDVAHIYDPYFDTHRHIEHEDHARRSGKHVARSALGEQEPYEYLPYFWSEVFGFSWEFWGDTAGADRVIHREAQRDEDMVVLWLKSRRLLAAWVPYSMPKEEKETLQEWIKSGQEVDVDRLADETTPIANIG